jgi:hypothetical protein
MIGDSTRQPAMYVPGAYRLMQAQRAAMDAVCRILPHDTELAVKVADVAVLAATPYLRLAFPFEVNNS